MRRSFSVRSMVRLVVCLVTLEACGGAYADAIQRGDKFAAAGMWNEAAAAYAEARKVDPVEPEAGIKLKQARRHQSSERIQVGKALVARGEIEKGLVALHEAAGLEPDNADAQATFADATAEALAQAEDMLKKGDAQKALGLTSFVLKLSPRDPRAKRVDGRVRDALAEAAYDRGADFEKRGKLGNALMEFAASLAYQTDFQDAKLRVGKIKLALEQELTFYVVLERFEGAAGGAQSLADVLTVDLLSQSFDPKLLLRVVDRLPAGRDNSRGVRVAGKFENYRYSQDRQNVSRTCDYQCGEDRRPNPDYDRMEKSVADIERRVGDVDRKIFEKQKDVDYRQRGVDDAQKDIDKVQADLEKKRDELDKCRAGVKPGESSSAKCSGEQSRMDTAQSALNSARSRMDSPRSFYEMARRQLQDAQSERESARRDLDSAKERLRNTPRENVIARMCPYNWTSALHSVALDVTVRMTAEQLRDKVRLLDDQAFPHRVEERDETFLPQPGRCSEASGGDPLQLPSEADLRVQLVNRAIEGVRERVLASYGGHRQRFLVDARRQEAAGVPEEAVEDYVRYVLSGSKSIDPQDQRQISEFLEKTRGFGKIDALPAL